MTMRFSMALGLGTLLVTLAGCGTAPVPATAPAGVEARATATVLAPASDAPYREAEAPITYRGARYPLHTDKIDLRTGAFLPVDDGMGPEGDLHFFYNGSAFYLAPNMSGGAARGIAPATGSADPATLSFSQGPVPVQAGDTYAIKTEGAIAFVVVDRLEPGTLRLEGREGSGQGAVVFRYRI